MDEERVAMADFNAKITEKGALFRIQAPFGAGARAIEQNERNSKYLNSGDSFFVAMPGLTTAYLWNGVGSSEDEAAMGAKLFDNFSKPFDAKLTFKEGEEPEEFWEAMGGKGEYSTSKELMINPSFEPRLFEVSNSTGFTFMKEIVAFAQEDMLNCEVYILDTYQTVYIWIGNQSNKFELKGAFKKAH